MRKYKKGDLIETRQGNYAIILDSDHIEKGWSDIMFINGHVRTGFNNVNIRRVVK
mgnify:CR=1 FL=1